MSMTKNEALAEAIDSVDYHQEESFEGGEREDPAIEAWIQKKLDAIDVLETLKGSEQKVEECYKAFIAVPQYDFERAKDVLRKYLGE